MLVKEMLLWGFIILASYIVYRKLKPEDSTNSTTTTESTEARENHQPTPYDDRTDSHTASSETTNTVDDPEQNGVVICTECGTHNKPKFRFCRECVQDLWK